MVFHGLYICHLDEEPCQADQIVCGGRILLNRVRVQYCFYSILLSDGDYHQLST